MKRIFRYFLVFKGLRVVYHWLRIGVVAAVFHKGWRKLFHGRHRG